MTNETQNNLFNDRLRQIINDSELDKKVFARQCGISPNQLYNYLNGSQEPGAKFFHGLKSHNPNINFDWLITGRGTPYIEIQHNDLARGFIDEQRAHSIISELIELEKIDPETFRRVESYVKGTLDTIREMAERPPFYEPDRRNAQGRSSDKNNSEYGDLERRSGKDRRKYAAQK